MPYSRKFYSSNTQQNQINVVQKQNEKGISISMFLVSESGNILVLKDIITYILKNNNREY